MIQNIVIKHKIVGTMDTEKGIYVSHRTREHIFRKFNGFGLSLSIIEYLYKNEIKYIIINFEDKQSFWTELKNFVMHGKEFNDAGDLQYILNMDFWKTGEIKTEEQKHLNTTTTTNIQS